MRSGAWLDEEGLGWRKVLGHSVFKRARDAH